TKTINLRKVVNFMILIVSQRVHRTALLKSSIFRRRSRPILKSDQPLLRRDLRFISRQPWRRVMPSRKASMLAADFLLAECRRARFSSADQRHPLQYLDSPSGVGVLPWRLRHLYFF